MKRLFLIRHAKSSWEFPELQDISRPLNEKGQTDAQNMGKYLAGNNYTWDLSIYSPAERTHETADAISPLVGVPADKIQENSALYTFDNPRVFTQIASGLDDSIKAVALFGHNFAIFEAANALCKGKIKKFNTCGVAIFDFDMDSWSKIDTTSATLVDYLKPEKHVS